MKNDRRISVVIPTYKRRDSVKRALDALLRQSLSPSSFEVVVAIDGSEDGTRELVAAYAAPYALKSIWQPNEGRAGACNAGIRAARGELIVILDDDMEPDPEFLASHLKAHAGGERRGVVGAVPIVLDSASTPVARYIRSHFEPHLELLAQRGQGIWFREFYSGNFSIPRALFLEVGLFDESFRIYGNEDGELAIRLLQAGVVLEFSREAAARQHYEKDFAALARDKIAAGRTAVLCARKHPTKVSYLLTYHSGSRRWRLLRTGLLALGRLFPAIPDRVASFVAHRERSQSPRLDTYYSLALDYFFWVGARRELSQHPIEGHRLSLWFRSASRSRP